MPHDPITEAELAALATAANGKCEPQDYTVTDTAVGGTLSGAFSFPSFSSTTLRALGDEEDRLYCSLYDRFQDVLPYEFDYGNGVNDTNFLGNRRVDTDRAVEVLSAWWAHVGGNERVVSEGPHFYTHCRNMEIGVDYRYCRAFRDPKFLFSRLDMPPFDMRGGFVLGTHDHPYTTAAGGPGVGGVATEAAPVEVSFLFSLPSASLYGQVWFDFEHEDGLLEGDPVDFNIGFTGDWGIGGSGVLERLANGRARVHLSNISVTTLIDNSGSGDIAGVLTFFAWMEDDGWYPVSFGMVGVIQTTVVNSAADAVTSTYDVIHPRNAAMREALHLSNQPELRAEGGGFASDILSQAVFYVKIRDRVDAVSALIYDSMAGGYATLQGWIDAYPGGANDALIESALVAYLNDLFVDDDGNLYDTGAWASVTLRPKTQWLLDIRPAGVLLTILNRLLIEDAYPNEIRRIPEDSFSVEDEIAQLNVPVIEPFGLDEDDVATSQIYWFADFVPGIWCTLTANEDTEAASVISGVYVAQAWPQNAYHSFLDLDLPQYHSTGPGATSSLRDPAIVHGIDDSEIGTVTVAAENQLSTWPVQDVAAFGQARTDAAGAYTGHAYAQMQHRVPYWNNDSHHTWSNQGTHTLAPNATALFSQFITDPDGNALVELARYEFGCGSFEDDVVVYVGVDIDIDPDNALTYLFSKPRGQFVFPDDFATPSDHYGSSVFFLFRNETATTQTLRVETSRMFSIAGEDPPHPEPLFFPRQSIEVSGALNMKLEKGQFVDETLSEQSMRFTQYDHSGWPAGTGQAYPIPNRGYMVHALIIRNRPEANSAGIMIPVTGASTVKIGIMAGTGVIAGATTGVFPGDFLEFTEVTLSAGESFKVVAVKWPVIDGCPLASQSTSGAHVITALVSFQPGVNVGFVDRTVAGIEHQGGYSGKPCFQSHLSHLMDHNTSGIRDGIVMMPLSRAVYEEYLALFTALPPA